MKPPELREAVLALMESHPDIEPSAAGHVQYAYRYVSAGGPLAVEPRKGKFQNLWVRADAVRLSRFGDIDKKVYFAANFGRSRPNHDLFTEPTFREADLVCMKVTNVWQAARVIHEVAGDGVST
jgi:hypothetical protein